MIEKRDQERILFVVAQIGQVKQAQALAHHLGFKSISMAILYTRKNLVMPRMMEADIDVSFVRNIRKVEIHPASNDLSAKAANFDAIAYRKLLDELKPSKLFVCSFERHYAILCREAKARGIRIALFEEGTAIFKVTVPGYQSFQKPTVKSSAKTIYNRVWKKHPIATHPITKYIIRPTIRFITPLAQLPYLIGRSIHEIYKTPQIQNRILRRQNEDFLRGWYEFDAVYSSSPKALQAHFPGSEGITYHPNHNRPQDLITAQRVIAQHSLGEETALFVSQKFDVKTDIQVPIVVRTLSQLSEQLGCRVVIKLHPRESEFVVSSYKINIAALHAENRLFVIEGEHTPAEAIIASTNLVAVVGVSSSTLMYSPGANPNTRVISIGRRLINELMKAKVGPELIQIEDHMRIIENVNHVEHFTASTSQSPNSSLVYFSDVPQNDEALSKPNDLGGVGSG